LERVWHPEFVRVSTAGQKEKRGDAMVLSEKREGGVGGDNKRVRQKARGPNCKGSPTKERKNQTRLGR